MACLGRHAGRRWRDSRWASRRHFLCVCTAVALFLAVGARAGSEVRRAPGPNATPSAPMAVHHIGAMFQVDNFTAYALAFRRAIANANNQMDAHVRLEGVALPSGEELLDNLKSAANRLTYICDAVQHNNITTFLAIGGQDMLNTLSIVTQYVGIPVIGYNTARQTVAIMVRFCPFF